MKRLSSGSLTTQDMLVKGYNFYGYKHIGVINFYMATKDL